MKGPVIQDDRAPMAIWMPISRVFSFTTAYMMLATPMPPMRSVRAPMIPRKSWRPIMMLPMILELFTVSQIPKIFVSSGSNRYLAPMASLNCWSGRGHVLGAVAP